ncbi:hypothetical protein HanIR_Chr10g0454701 [Helianthus annuus]|nr:hypothetical protein HanIR_Chr10g0454701 [Helianthus annuus]
MATVSCRVVLQVKSGQSLAKIRCTFGYVRERDGGTTTVYGGVEASFASSLAVGVVQERER